MERGKEIWGEDRKKAYRKEHGEEDGSFLMTLSPVRWSQGV